MSTVDVVRWIRIVWRKAPPWTQSSFLYPSSSQSSLFDPIEVREVHPFSLFYDDFGLFDLNHGLGVGD